MAAGPKQRLTKRWAQPTLNQQQVSCSALGSACWPPALGKRWLPDQSRSPRLRPGKPWSEAARAKVARRFALDSSRAPGRCWIDPLAPGAGGGYVVARGLKGAGVGFVTVPEARCPRSFFLLLVPNAYTTVGLKTMVPVTLRATRTLSVKMLICCVRDWQAWVRR